MQELRQKEKVIQKQIDDGIDYEAGQVTVIELLEKYISLKKGVRYNAQRGYSTITSVRGVVKPAFQMAFDEDAIRKNPFIFKLTDVVVNDTVPRVALTEEQLAIWMNFIEGYNTYSKYYDEFVVLLETGMRVSEFCGLTRKDLDFKNRRIRVDHQLVRERGGNTTLRKPRQAADAAFYR